MRIPSASAQHHSSSSLALVLGPSTSYCSMLPLVVIFLHLSSCVPTTFLMLHGCWQCWGVCGLDRWQGIVIMKPYAYCDNDSPKRYIIIARIKNGYYLLLPTVHEILLLLLLLPTTYYTAVVHCSFLLPASPVQQDIATTMVLLLLLLLLQLLQLLLPVTSTTIITMLLCYQ